MTTRTLRKIITIDEERCDGCGICITACAEGALHIVDGKAKLVSEKYCDGLGACLGECPQGAIVVEDREVEEFNEEAVKQHLRKMEHATEELACGCPSATVTLLERQEPTGTAAGEATHPHSTLGHWPVQLTLVPPDAPFLKGADLLLTADCVPFAYAGFHQDLLKGHALVVGCPKLDNSQAHLSKLTEILRHSHVKSLTVVHMEVPCCFGLIHMAQQAILASGQDVPFEKVVIGTMGDLKS